MYCLNGDWGGFKGLEVSRSGRKGATNAMETLTLRLIFLCGLCVKCIVCGLGKFISQKSNTSHISQFRQYVHEFFSSQLRTFFIQVPFGAKIIEVIVEIVAQVDEIVAKVFTVGSKIYHILLGSGRSIGATQWPGEENGLDIILFAYFQYLFEILIRCRVFFIFPISNAVSVLSYRLPKS